MGRFLHVYIKPNKESSKEQIETKLNLAIDWYRYANDLYIIYTTSDADKWQERLLQFVEDDGSLFLCQFEINERNGWMSQDFWDWIKKPRSK